MQARTRANKAKAPEMLRHQTVQKKRLLDLLGLRAHIEERQIIVHAAKRRRARVLPARAGSRQCAIRNGLSLLTSGMYIVGLISLRR